MHPAPSIILFTTLSGCGYGLAVALGLGLLDPAAVATKVAHVLALSLIAGGLLSSTLHLGNPQRAWRALSQWRTSWLSREGVLAILTFVPLTWTAALSIFADAWSPGVGLTGAALSLVTVVCTAMIYASLRSVQGWNHRLTPVCYVLFAWAAGLTLAAAFRSAGAFPALPLGAVAALVAAWAAKWAWWKRLDGQVARSTPETATGLGHIGQVALFESPHVNDNYLTREMVYRVGRKHALKLRRLALTFGAALPALLLLASAVVHPGGWAPTLLAGAAALTLFLGLLVERWLFFAEARHAVETFYRPR